MISVLSIFQGPKSPVERRIVIKEKNIAIGRQEKLLTTFGCPMVTPKSVQDVGISPSTAQP